MRSALLRMSALFAVAAITGCSLCGLCDCDDDKKCCDKAANANACFPPGGVDHMAMRITVEVEISGIGRDEVNLEGNAAVHRSCPQDPDGTKIVGDLVGGAFRGKSTVFGEVVAWNSPIQHSPCTYTCKKPGEYTGRFDINAWFWLPDHGLVIFNGKPVAIEGPADQIPPVGQKAQLVGGEIPLYSFKQPTGNPIGTLFKARGEIGELVRVRPSLETPDATVPELSKK